jgi:hypothetical protein
MRVFSRKRLLPATALVAVLCASIGAPSVEAARIGVLSNANAAAVAADFSSHITGHTFTAVDVSGGPPSAASLTASFDEILLFEDGVFSGATDVGNAVFQFASAGHPVILGTFYDQDRSDRTKTPANYPNPPLLPANGWGSLETIDPNTTDGFGTSYEQRILNGATIVEHPLTAGVTSLFADATHGYAGGNQAKPGTQVLATWTEPNQNGQPDPAIALRIHGRVCTMHIGIAPDYSVYGAFGSAYGGNFYQAWQNAFDFGANDCNVAVPVPALSAATPTVLALLIALLAAFMLRRRQAR